MALTNLNSQCAALGLGQPVELPGTMRFQIRYMYYNQQCKPPGPESISKPDFWNHPASRRRSNGLCEAWCWDGLQGQWFVWIFI